MFLKCARSFSLQTLASPLHYPSTIMENTQHSNESIAQRARALMGSLVRTQKQELNRRVPYWVWSAGLLFTGFTVVSLALVWFTYMVWALIKNAGLGEAEAAALVLLSLGGIAGALFSAFSRIRREELTRRKQNFLDRQAEFNGIEAQGSALLNALSEEALGLIHQAEKAIDPSTIVKKHVKPVVATAALAGFMFGVRRANALRENAFQSREHIQ